MPLVTFFTIFILGPIPIFHFFLHLFLKFWKRNPKALYLMGALLWVIFFILAWFLSKISVIIFVPSQWLVILSGITIFGAFFLLVWSITTLGFKRFWFWAVISPDKVRQAYIKFGPYRSMSHPAYTAYIAIAIAAFFATGHATLLIFIAYIIILIITVVYLENEELRKRVDVDKKIAS
tara:strand:- start:274 stop:807 length:534 start_codon:yes stop_codon:yes gene_type:complete